MTAIEVSTLLVPATTHGRVLVRRSSAATAKGLLLGFHGYAEHAAVQLERLARIPGAESWTLVSVQALNRFYRGRSEEVGAGWMTREDREAAIADNIRYVDAVIDAVRADERWIESDGAHSTVVPIVHAGFSQGVAMAFRAAVRGRFGSRGVIAVGGDIPPELIGDRSAHFPSVLLARGTREEWYTPDKYAADLAALERRGVAVHGLEFDGGHEWTPAVADAAGDFLARL